MKILHYKKIPLNALNGVVSIGTFDGVHLAHQKILDVMKDYSISNNNLPSTLITFSNHPRQITDKSSLINILNSKKEKVEILSKNKLDNLIILKFSQEFSKINSFDFIKNYIEILQPKCIVIGRDHFFGNNKQGNIDILRSYDFNRNVEIIEIPEIFPHNLKVSSSIIRKLLQDGDLETANKLLGYNYFIIGKVEYGFSIGKKLGFPTANIKVNKQKLIPKNGVYAVKVYVLNKKYAGMLYIGNRPTFNMKKISIEVNIFDFDENIYMHEIKVELISRIRDDIKFADNAELIKQIIEDKNNALKFLYNL